MNCEATYVSEVWYHCVKSPGGKLQAQQSLSSRATTCHFVNVLGDLEVTLGGIIAYMCRGLAQEGLVGKDFLWPYKCVFNTGTVHTKDRPSKRVFRHLNKVCRVTINETSLSPNMVAKIPCEVHKANGLDGLVGVLEPADKFMDL